MGMKYVVAATSAVCVALAAPVTAQVRFERPVQVLVPYPPGGSVDISVRMVAEKITAAGGPAMVIQNRAGAGGIVAAQALKAAPADGHTVLIGDHGLFGILPVLQSDMPVDVRRDFAPVALLRSHNQICATLKKLAADTVAQFLDLARKTQGGLSYASQSPGSSGHILGAMLAKATGAPLVHVPYRGEAPAVTDLVSGQVAMLCTSYDGLMAQIEGDTLKVLAVARKTRDPLLPKVPTFEEAGVGLDEFVSWNGVFVTAGTPAPVVDALAKLFTDAVNAPDVAGRLRARGIDIANDTPAGFARFIEDYRPKVERIIRTTGVKLE